MKIKESKFFIPKNLYKKVLKKCVEWIAVKLFKNKAFCCVLNKKKAFFFVQKNIKISDEMKKIYVSIWVNEKKMD